MRLAVLSAPADADRVAALLERTGVPVLAGVGDLHDEIARRHGVEPADLVPPVHVGADLWFRLRQAAREGDLAHADWAVTGPDVLPHLLGTWRYVAPDLSVVVVRPSDGTPLATSAVAYVAAHPGESVVVDAEALDAFDLAGLRAAVAAAGGGDLGDLDALDALGAVEPAAVEAELLRAEVQVLRARLAAVPDDAAARPAKPARATKQPQARRRPAADPARDDLVALLDWLGTARSATLVRKDKRFRDLRDRYPDGGS